MGQYLRKRNGEFNGMIGDGKTKTPKVRPQQPAPSTPSSRGNVSLPLQQPFTVPPADMSPSKVWDESAFGGMLFHGTDKTFQPGDIIKPVTKKVAHATPDFRTAKVFAGKNTPKVYEVAPVKHESVWTRQMKHTGGEVHWETLSVDGFIVVKEVPSHSPVNETKYARRAEETKRRIDAWTAKHNGFWCQECFAYHTANADPKYRSCG